MIQDGRERETNDPKNCGIVETDNQNIVINFFEKENSPPSNNANAAIYLIENEVLDFIRNIDSETIDFSTEVIPHFLGKIATWKNKGIHIDSAADSARLCSSSNR